jgi:transposase
MPRERASMRKIREVLRLRWQCGLSQRQIATSCALGLGTVSEYLRRAGAAGVTWPLPAELGDAELERRLFPPAPDLPTEQRPLPDWAEVQKALKGKGVTLQLLWLEYRDAHPDGYGYSRFTDLYREWREQAEPRMRQHHVAGEKLFVDYAGQTMPVIEPHTGEVRPAQIFVGTLGASSYTYAEATAGQTIPDWLASHARLFSFLGGVPQVVVPDNLKAGVRSPCFFDPEITPSYLELARHYGVAIIPARVRKPRDKAKVESGVQQVERWVLAPLRNHQFFSLIELNEALAERVQALNDRSAPGLPASRSELFRTLDQPALRPLPLEPYAHALWLKARVNVDYHVAVEKHWYSVPYQLLRQQVDVRLTSLTVEIFFEHQRVASHPRATRPHGHTTQAEHMPPQHRDYSEWSPERFRTWAGQYGPHTQAVIEQLLAARSYPQQAFRGCLGVLRLGTEYGAERLEAACRRALTCQAVSYKSIRSILATQLDRAPLPETPTEPAPIPHDNVRGAAYYDGTAP